MITLAERIWRKLESSLDALNEQTGRSFFTEAEAIAIIGAEIVTVHPEIVTVHPDLDPIRTITITFNFNGDGPTPFVVAEGEKNSGELCWDEMLGQVVELTHPGIKHSPRYAMKTDAEWETGVMTPLEEEGYREGPHE